MKWFCWLLVFVLIFSLSTATKRVSKWHQRIAQEQGPNACVVEEIPGTGHKYWTERRYWVNRDFCGIRSVLRYQCCEGFIQVKGMPGCSGVKPMTNVLDSARDIGATKFVEYLNEGGLAQQLKTGEKAVTLFAPTNEAFEALGNNFTISIEESIKERRSPYLTYHIASNKLVSSDVIGTTEVDTIYGDQRLRVARYGSGLMTVNCAIVLRKDQQATNGVVHLIDRVLVPPDPDGHSNVAEAVFMDGRFRELARLMIETDFINELRGKRQFTILAPSDDAFEPLRYSGQLTSAHIEAKKALMKSHIIPHIVCISAITDSHKIKNIDGNFLDFTCNQTGLYANGARLTEEVITTNNGLIYVIEDVIIPDRARTLHDLMTVHSDKLIIFLTILKSAEMEQIFKEPNTSLTIFAPTDEAFKSLNSIELENIMSDVEKARDLINYHAVHGRYKTINVADNQKVVSLDRQNTLRVKVYRKATGVESAMIKEADIEGVNGILHIIDRVLPQPSTSIMEMVETTGDFSMFADAVHRVRKTEPKFLGMESKSASSFTLFAPVNKAFHKLGRTKLRSLMRNKRDLKKVIRNHVVDNMYSAGSFKSDLMYDLRTEFQTVHVHKEKDTLMVNDAHVIEPDVLTTDGIVHCIDKVLIPKSSKPKASRKVKT